MKIGNDPFRIVCRAFKALWPAKDALVEFHPNIQPPPARMPACNRPGEAPAGCTTWSQPGALPLVSIAMDIQVCDAVEVLLHELAHVAAGPAAGHGRKWRTCHERLSEKFNDLVERDARRLGRGLVLVRRA